MAGGGSCTSWVVEGARRRGWWWSRVSGFVVVGARRHSWVVGCSLSSMGWRCGRSSLFVLGLVVVYALWMVVVVYGGCRVRRRGRGLVVVHALWLVVVCERLWWWL